MQFNTCYIKVSKFNAIPLTFRYFYNFVSFGSFLEAFSPKPCFILAKKIVTSYGKSDNDTADPILNLNLMKLNFFLNLPSAVRLKT